MSINGLQTVERWKSVCNHIIANKSSTSTMADYILSERLVPITLIKHDVECNPQQALNIAEIEASFGIKATYYFQKEILYDRPDIVSDIAGLGHEVAYHYDVLDECNGDIKSAIETFTNVLNDFSDEEKEKLENVTDNIIKSLAMLIDKKLDLFSSTVNNK